MRADPSGATGTRKTYIARPISEARLIPNPSIRQRLAAEWMNVPGMTQAQLAKMFGVSQAAISQRLKAYREATADEYGRVVAKARRRLQTVKAMQLSF